MQWLQYQKENYVENLNNVRRKAGRHFKKKGEDIGKVKLMNLKQTVRMRISENSRGA
jgi:hypothetical protein